MTAHQAHGDTPAERLAAVLDGVGWTQAHIADRIDVTPSYLSSVKNAREPLTTRLAYALQRLLGVHAEWLLEGTGPQYVTDRPAQLPSIRCYLTVGGDGLGVLTGLEPVVRRVLGTERVGVYCRPGYWLLVKGLCREGVERVLGEVPPVGEPRQVELTLRLLEEED